MDNNQNIINNNQQKNELYTMINDLKNKYEILEKKQKMNEELSMKNKEINLNLNIYLKSLKDLVIDLKNRFEQHIGEMKEMKANIDKIKKGKDINEIRKISIEQINNLEKKYGEMNKEIDKKIEILKNEVKDIKININNNINNNNNNINIKNNNNNININNNKDIELKIDKNEEKTIFQKFENLLATIIEKNDIDDKIQEELNQYCEKLIINNISPIEYSSKYFSMAYKYFQNAPGKEAFEKILKANEKIISAVNEIENKITKKIKDIKHEKKPNKKVDKKIEEFRKKYSVREEDASDKQIKESLKKVKNDEQKAYEAIINKILNENKKNKPK